MSWQKPNLLFSINSELPSDLAAFLAEEFLKILSTSEALSSKNVKTNSTVLSCLENARLLTVLCESDMLAAKFGPTFVK